MKYALPFVLFLAACPEGKPADEGPHCEDTYTAIAMDEVTPLGISANDVLAEVPASESTALVYADGSATALTLGFAPGATASFVDSEAVYPEGGEMIDIAVICDDRIEVDGTFTFSTDDGAFAESFAAPVVATLESVTLRQELDLDALSGSFDIVPFVTAEDWDELSAWIDVSFADGESSGSVEGQASGQDECAGDECSAWAEMVEVGSWQPVVDPE